MLQRVSPPLVSAYLKLIRAQEHMDPLVHEIRNYEWSKPYRLVRETDAEAGEYVAYAVLNEVPGDRWYGPLGDVINNLHGVLDHAVFGLSQFFEQRRLTEVEAKNVYFPVFSDPEKWAGFVAAKSAAIRFLPDQYREIIEREQPHRARNDYIRTSHPMHVLHTLWNLDKHRQITFFGQFGKVVDVYMAGYGDRAYRVTPPVVDNGSEVVRVPISRVESEEDFEPIIQVEITLNEGGPPRNPVTGARQPIAKFAGQMHSAVFEVLSGFQDLLDRGIR
jgi:hypothetical protein